MIISVCIGMALAVVVYLFISEASTGVGLGAMLIGAGMYFYARKNKRETK